MLRRLVVPAAVTGLVAASVAGIAHAAVPGGGTNAGADRSYVTLKASHVGSSDLVDESRSKGVTEANVTHPLAGTWCISGLSFTPKLAIASVDATWWNHANHILASVKPQPVCPEGTQAQLIVYNSMLDERLDLPVAAIFE